MVLGLLAPLALGATGWAQTNPPPVQAEPKAKPGATNATALPPVVVTATPLPSSLFDLAQPVTVLSADQLQKALAPTLGETLAREPGMTSTYFGPNASRPVIRGLDADHIRLLQNGVGNMDVSDLAPDHTVAQDPLTVTRIEVVRGPAALLYGPTAVGGVVNVIDNRIPDTRIDAPMTGSMAGRYTSPDHGRNAAGILEGGFKGFNYHFDGLLHANDDLEIPGFARSRRLRARDPLPAGETEAKGTLPNSQAHSDSGVAGLSYVWAKGYAGGSFQSFHNNYGTVAEADVTDHMFQRRWDLAGAFEEPVSFLRTVKWKFGRSDYQQTEFEGRERGTSFNLDALNGRIEALHKSLGPFEGSMGYEVRRDELDVTGHEATLPPTDSFVNSAFLFEQVKLEKLRLQFGGRLDHSDLDAAADAQFGPARSLSFNTGSGAAGLVYRPTERYSAALNFSYTQRAPTQKELFSNGPDLGSGYFLVGDPTLPPERSYGLDFTLRKETGNVTGSATFFYTHFENFITPTPRGSVDPTFHLPIYDVTGVPTDFLGTEGSVVFHLLRQNRHTLQLELKTDYVRARNTDSGDPLPRIPPWRFGAELGYEWNHRFGASLDVRRAQSQHETAPNELPTDGYTMLDCTLRYRIGTGPVTWDLLCKGTNLLNEEARQHTSFIKDIAPLAGRGALVALRASF